ncbi:MAG: hypothetical protein JXQ90_11500 [Cyclobacteriaceae bacterium]
MNRILKLFKSSRPLDTDPKQVFKGEEIKLIDLFNLFWERRHIFILPLILCFLLSLVAISIETKFYTAKITVLSETGEDNRKSKISGFASLAGISLDGGVSSASLEDPSFYPSIIKNNLFLADLMEEKFFFREYKTKLRLVDYFFNYDDRSGIPLLIEELKNLPQTIKQVFVGKPKKKQYVKVSEEGYGQRKYKGDSVLLTFTAQQQRAMTAMSRSIKLNTEGRFVTLFVTTTDKTVSAALTELVMNKLVEFVKRHRTAKERTTLSFIEKRTSLAKLNYIMIQNELADFKDRNRGSISNKTRAIEQRLTAEFQIASKIYAENASKLEQSKIVLEEKTPVYTVFEPTQIPIKENKSSTTFTVVQFLFIGLVIGGIIVVADIIVKLIR